MAAKCQARRIIAQAIDLIGGKGGTRTSLRAISPFVALWNTNTYEICPRIFRRTADMPIGGICSMNAMHACKPLGAVVQGARQARAQSVELLKHGVAADSLGGADDVRHHHLDPIRIDCRR